MPEISYSDTSFINWPQELDVPCTDPDPMLWVHNACNHSATGQSLTVFEALRMCTYNGCYASFDEKERGSLDKWHSQECYPRKKPKHS